LDIQACFADISSTISAELDAARQSIVAAVAWLTDPALFEVLLKAARRGCRVQLALLNDAINHQSGLNPERLRAAGGEVFWIPEALGNQGSLHHKFCVIDHDCVITGSYNWTRRAARADENIIRVRGDAALAAGYVEAFAQLLDKHCVQPREPAPDRQQVLRRLEVIHNLLLLEDYESLAGQLPRLAAARSLPEVAEVLDSLQRQDWATAQAQLAALLARGLALIPYEDPELAAFRLELRTLEAQVVALSQEQAEVERLIQEFARCEQAALGDFLEEALRLREQYWQQRAAHRAATEAERTAYSQARTDYADYQNSRAAAEPLPQTPPLDPDQQAELKRLFRETSMLCHPDRVTEADQAQAQALFIEVRAAYQRGDLETLQRLHRQLKSGRPFADPATVLTEGDQLRKRVAQLRLEVERLLAAVQALRQHETYQTLVGIADWEQYFAEARQRLVDEIARLRVKVTGMNEKMAEDGENGD